MTNGDEAASFVLSSSLESVYGTVKPMTRTPPT